MIKATPLLSGFLLFCLTAAPAFSQGAKFQSFDFKKEIDLDLAYLSESKALKSDLFQADLRARFAFETMHSSQMRYGIRFNLAALTTDGARGASATLKCLPICPKTSGALTGLTDISAIDAAEDRAGLENFEIYLKRPYYNIQVGKLETSSISISDGGLTAFRLLGADTDLIGPGLVMTKSSFGSGWGGRLTSRRLAGIEVSGSFMLKTDPCNFRRCRSSALGSSKIENLASMGVDYKRSTQGTNWRFELAGEYGRLKAPIISDQVDPWLFRLAIHREKNGFHWSGNALFSNDGLSSGGYHAYSTSLTREVGDWLVSGQLGYAQSQAFDSHGYELVIGVSKFLNDHVLLTSGFEITNAYESSQSALITEIGLRF